MDIQATVDPNFSHMDPKKNEGFIFRRERLQPA